MTDRTLEAAMLPSREALLALNANLNLPTHYAGEHTSPRLAAIFLELDSLGLQPFAGTALRPVEGATASNNFEVTYEAYLGFLSALRGRGLVLEADNELLAAWWNLLDVLPLDEDEDAVFYLLALLVHYGAEFANMTATFNTVLRIEHARLKRAYPSIHDFDRYAALMRQLIEEDGVMLSHEQFWYAAKFWDYEEIRRLLLSGKDREYAMRLAAMGAGESVEEILAAFPEYPREMVELFTKGMFVKE